MNHTRKAWEKVKSMNIKHNFTLGPINTEWLLKDTKHLAFSFSRYKFAAKMLKDCRHIIEIGCGEGIGALTFLAETTAKITAIDFDNCQIEYAKRHLAAHTKGRINFICQDLISQPYKGKKADGLVCLDVIEHVHPLEEKKFLKKCAGLINKKGVVLFGTPNKYVEKYGSLRSKQGHINLFYPERLSATLKEYFTHVFLFSMNDEVVHTGYDKLAHYLLALCIK